MLPVFPRSANGEAAARRQADEAHTTGQSTTEAPRTTRRSTLTIAQLRVGGALAHRPRSGMNVCKSVTFLSGSMF